MLVCGREKEKVTRHPLSRHTLRKGPSLRTSSHVTRCTPHRSDCSPIDITMKAKKKNSDSNSLARSPVLREVYSATTDPTKVDRPVGVLVHAALRHAWTINNDHKMAHIFDSVNPARQFKRGMPDDPEASFPEYGPENDEYVTDTDGPAPGWMQFNPKPYT